MAKRAREQAVRERRERKQAKKAEAAAARAAAKDAPPEDEALDGTDSVSPALPEDESDTTG
ncbi:MAG TPA: hypothetical protein VFA56_12320 [Gaiellaceae bacterium]|nr:hypothetical protein [Gaiellaceae bacterium]